MAVQPGLCRKPECWFFHDTAHLTVTFIQKVEEASNHAAEQVFGTSHTSGRARGRAAAQMTKDHVADNEQAYSEGKNDFLTDFHS